MRLSPSLQRSRSCFGFVRHGPFQGSYDYGLSESRTAHRHGSGSKEGDGQAFGERNRNFPRIGGPCTYLLRNNAHGGHGIVGGQIPCAGIAFADKYFDRDSCNLTFMGDGATCQGSLHETFNLAMLWIYWLFCVENNGYAGDISGKNRKPYRYL